MPPSPTMEGFPMSPSRRPHRFLALAFTVLLSWSLSVAAADTIRIAYIGMLSGPFALVGEEVLKTFRAAADLVNARGGVLGGRTIGIVAFDGKGTPQGSLLALNQAIDQGIPFVTAAVSSVAHALTGAIARHNEREPDRRVLFLDFQATDPALTEEKCNFWHFRFSAHAGTELDVLTTYMARSAGLRSIYLVNPDNPYGQAASRIARELLAAKRPDVTIVGDDLVPLGKVKDFSPYIAKIRAARADGVLTGNWGMDLSLLVKAGRDVDLDVTFFSLIAYLPGTPAVIAGKGAERVKTVTLGFDLNRTANPFRARNAAFKARYRTVSNFDYAPAIRVVEMLAAAIQRAGTADPLRVALALENTRYADAAGEIWMRAEDHQLVAPIEIASLAPVGSEGVSVDVENSGFGWKVEMRSESTEAVPPVRCTMQRPGP